MEISVAPRAPIPPFDAASAALKVRLIEDAWNTRDPDMVALAFTEDSRWRTRSDLLIGQDDILDSLRLKWTQEIEYRLTKELWVYHEHRIAARFAYEWRDNQGNWFRSFGNEAWEFNKHGLLRWGTVTINDVSIAAEDRMFHWPLGRRPDNHPGLTRLEL